MAKGKGKAQFDFERIAVALSTGAAFGGAIQLAAKKIAFVNDHYTLVRAGSASLFGTALSYFGHGDKNMEAAAYALLGIGGDSGSRFVATMLESDEAPVQGLGAINPRARQLLETLCKDRGTKHVPSAASSAAAHVRPDNTRGGGGGSENLWLARLNNMADLGLFPN